MALTDGVVRQAGSRAGTTPLTRPAGWCGSSPARGQEVALPLQLARQAAAHRDRELHSALSLKHAREQRDGLRAQVVRGVDPRIYRPQAKAAVLSMTRQTHPSIRKIREVVPAILASL